MQSSNWFDKLESTLGYFDVAISFSGDRNDLATKIAELGAYYDQRCYLFTNEVIHQSGFNIYNVMEFVYAQTPAAVILNSPKYRATRPTQFEFSKIVSSTSVERILVIECGGKVLNIKSKCVEMVNSLDFERVIRFLQNVQSS